MLTEISHEIGFRRKRDQKAEDKATEKQLVLIYIDDKTMPMTYKVIREEPRELEYPIKFFPRVQERHFRIRKDPRRKRLPSLWDHW